MISKEVEYVNILNNRLDENWKSFNILLGLKHYGNCISNMCQELDQFIKILFLLKQSTHDRKQFINNSINNQKWFIALADNKREYITDGTLRSFAETLTGWEKAIFDFGYIFKNLSNNFNYMLKDPIKSLDNDEREVIYKYIIEYHNSGFIKEFTINELMQILPSIFVKILDNIKEYSNKF